jgi:hypothetical protein
MPDPPRLDAVTPASARAGTELTLTGAGFGTRNAGSAVRFRVPVAGAAPVAGSIVDWAAATIRVQVPSLASFGSGGPLDVTVHTDAGDSSPAAFVIEEPSPPALTSIRPERGLENDTVTLTGERFGRPASGSTVLFQAPGPTDVPATVLSWAPASITARVPSLASLGGAGPRTVAVATPWGRSGTAAFLLGELPEITSVEPASPSPGGTITVRGRAFGAPATGTLALVAVYPTEDPDAPVNVTAPRILSWTDTEIRAELPELPGLLTTGTRDVVVTSEWGASRGDQRSRILIESRASITCWTRLEPHARTADLQYGLGLGLQAQVYDPLWLLGRQWQMLELRGSDGGSPVNVQVQGRFTPLARWQPHGGSPEHTPPGVPLEAVVERERVLPPLDAAGDPFDDLRLTAEAGLQLLRMIDARLRDPGKSDDYRKRFLRVYGMQLPADTAALDVASRRFLAVAAGRVPDGSRMYADFQTALQPHPQLPHQPPIDGNDRDGVLAAIREWYDWCAEIFSEPTPGQFGWDRQRMEYSFSAGSADLVLDAREHDGGHLDWYSFVRRGPGTTLGTPAPGRGPVPFTRTSVPTPVSYPGMPVPRWWELEDRRVDFGSVAAAPSELLKLILVEFATVYGNDWFTVMLDAMPVGNLCEIATVTVTDAFGASITVAPFGDGAGTDWRMFELTNDDGTADAGHALLLLDALPTTYESTPLEDVLMLRDELANLAWAVEKTVPSRTGRPLNRHEDEVTRRAEPPPPTSAAARRYVLRTPVPRNWIPLLPRFDRDTGGAVTRRLLARGAIREHLGGAGIPPLGRLLEPGVPLDVYDEEVPRSGVRVARLWTLGRGADGSTHLWRGRRKGPGRGEGSSGLRFDDTER